MLENTISTKLELAPEVFIDSAQIENDKITIFYHLDNNATNWILDDNILQNTNIHVFLNDTGSVESLQSFKNRAAFTNNGLYGHTTVYTTASTVRLDAYCGNLLFNGYKTTDYIVVNDVVSQATYDSASLKYINKYLDFRLLEIQPMETKSVEYVPTDLYENLYISHTTDKKANVAFVFDLEKYLYNSSSTYRALSSQEYYKQLILSSSVLKPEDITFYKKNLTEGKDYQYIFSKVNLYKTDVSSISSSYIVTFTDDNINLNNFSEYCLKMQVMIPNYAIQVFSTNIKKNLESIVYYLSNYKNLLESIFLNNTIKDKYKYFFDTRYEQEIDHLASLIEQLSLIYSFYNKNYSRMQYATLFSSMLHPLVTRVELIELLITSVTELGVQLKFLDSEAQYDHSNLNKKEIYPPIFFEKEFKYSSLDGREIYDSIDYNYDAFYGYELMSMDTTNNRAKKTKNGLDVYTVPERNARKELEYRKFYTTTLSADVNSINNYTISGLDLGEEYFNLCIGQPTNDFSFYNDLFLKIKQLNNGEKITKIPEYYYINLKNNNVYIKSIGKKFNTSTNTYFQSVVFDPNEQSKESSLKYLTDTGANLLYYIVNTDKFIPLESGSLQYLAAQVNDIEVGSTFPVTQEILDNPQTKAKTIIHYNNIFKEEIKLSGETYSIYSLEEQTVHPIFNKKLKLFNKYYILQNVSSNVIESTLRTNTALPNILAINDLKQELKFDKKSYMLNRNIQESNINITTSEI